MLEFAKAIIVSGTLLYGAANIDPVSTDSSLMTTTSNVAARICFYGICFCSRS
jgi:hypothetical protein